MRKFHRFQAWPLWMQITVALLVVCTLIVVVTGESVRHREKAYLLKNIEENKTRVMEIIASTALESIITEDVPVLNTIVTQLTASNSDIVELRLENENSTVLASWKSNAFIDNEYISSYSEPIIYEGETFGLIYIKWNLENKLRDISNHILSIYIINSIVMFLFTAISIIGINRLVTLPIRDIESRLIEHSEGKTLSEGEIISSEEFANLYAAVDKIRELTISKDELLSEIERRKEVQQELAIARDKALGATETKSAFLANMSHEIRTPLTAIVGFSETLLDSNQSMSDRVESIQTIIRSGRHLQSLINDILDLSKIEAGKVELDSLDVNLFDIMSDIYSLARLQAEEKALYCKLDYHYPIPEIIYADPLRLKQILINLCGNAIKFTEEGGIRIDVQYKKGTNTLVIRVIDTGLGMTPEQQSKIFSAFTQADNTTSRKFGGTGLGLYLSKSLAEKIGGNLQVDSTLNAGSCFVLSLDAGPSAENSLVNSEPGRDKIVIPEMPKLQGHILLAEDNPDNQRLIKFMLNRLGITCDIANNGHEAVAMAQSSSYEIVLMDMQMPGMNGIDATIALREKGYKGNITALTANATADYRDKCLESGFDEFLTKPIDRKVFNDFFVQHLRPDADKTNIPQSDEPVISSLIDDPIISELLPAYRQRLPEIIEEITQALAAGEMENLRLYAHNLKATSGNYGYMQLHEMAGKLEFEVVKGDIAGINKLLTKINSMKERICNIT